MEVLIDSSGYFEDGRFIHTRCFTRDVTAQRGVEAGNRAAGGHRGFVGRCDCGQDARGRGDQLECRRGANLRIHANRRWSGQSIFRLIPDELHGTERDLLERIRQGEPVQFSETERVRKDGRRIYIALSVSPILDSQGRVIGASSIKRDVTERKQAQDALAQSQERLQLALKAARMGTWRWEVASNALSWDEGLNQLYGVDPRRAGHPVRTVYRADLS